MILSRNTDHLFAKYYFCKPGFIDGTTEFHRLLSPAITRGGPILEIGSGPTNETTHHLAAFGNVVGVDVSEEIKSNADLTDALTFDGIHLPFANDCFDACVSNWVVEHIQEPAAHFAEVARVLKPGGAYCFRTPNLWHYFTLGSRLLPFSMHMRLANKLRGIPGGAHDPYPTRYLANTFRKIRQLSVGAGLVPSLLIAIEKEPSYGRFHPALFYSMLLYERAVNSREALRFFRASLIAMLVKPCGTPCFDTP